MQKIGSCYYITITYKEVNKSLKQATWKKNREQRMNTGFYILTQYNKYKNMSILRKFNYAVAAT
jgi:hypothetical protein